VCVFAGFWTGVWGHFTVNSMRSFDGGYTFIQPVIVFAPNVSSGYNAGSPQVSLCIDIERVLVVYMCNAPPNDDHGATLDAPSWPDGAHIEARSTFLNPSNSSLPLSWDASPRAFQPLVTPFAFWPSLFADSQAIGAVPTAAHSMRLGYQGSDNAAYLLDGTLCLD
jgi:hypothetical protein